MWPAVAKYSSTRSLRFSYFRSIRGKDTLIAVTADSDTLERSFSSSSGGGSGRDDGNDATFRSSIRRDNDKQKKPRSNFQRDVLLPASRGILTKKHSSGIPSLAAKRHKANLAPPGGRAGSRAPRKLIFGEIDEDGEYGDDDDDDAEIGNAFQGQLLRKLSQRTSSDERGDLFDDDDDGIRHDPMDIFGAIGEGRPVRYAKGTQNPNPVFSLLENKADPEDSDLFDFKYYAEELMDDDRYYWKEEDYEDEVERQSFGKLSSAEKQRMVKEAMDWAERFKRGEFKKDADGMVEFDDDETEYYEEEVEEGDDEGSEEGDEVEDLQSHLKATDLETYTELEKKNLQLIIDRDEFYGDDDLEDALQLPEELYHDVERVDPIANIPLPLMGKPSDTAKALSRRMIEHPTDYATFDLSLPHPDSAREPRFCFLKSREQPPKEFVHAHARFLFVTGLPPLVEEGANIEDPVYRSSLRQKIAELVDVDSHSVSPANLTSAFVGFDSPRELLKALNRGPKESVLWLKPTLQFYKLDETDGSSESTKKFAEIRPDCIVELKNIPPKKSAHSLINNVILDDEKIAQVYGSVTPDDVHFITETTALIRFASREQAESAIGSELWSDSLQKFGRYPVRYIRARRELVHKGWDPVVEIRALGDRLIVDSDMPSKKFFIHHADTLHLWNLDPSVTKADISAAFQKFSARPHSVDSVELVYCEAGLPTGEAYVGFDIPGEGVAADASLHGRMMLGGNEVRMRPVWPRQYPGRPALMLEKRPDRTAEELLDDLNNWEKFVDPLDLQFLEEHDIPKVVIDEALRGVRFNNMSFGSFDSGMETERMRPDLKPGTHYKEFVKLYVTTLKDCIATPDDVGETYEMLHLPDEPIDLSIFDREKERQHKLMEKRGLSPR